MPITAVVFDIGRVLIEWEPERFYDSLIGETRRKALFEEVDLHGTNLNVDRGDPFRDSIYALADKHPDWAGEIRHWHDSWIKMASPEIPHSVRLLRALRTKGIPVYALSNFGAETFVIAQTVYPFLREFDQAFVSAHLRAIKPDAEIYAELEAGTGRRPEELLFTDDRPENITAAAIRGWQTHLFDQPETWAARLVAEGLLTEEEAR
ncbi:HAD family hydrolase [Tritonibacter horizontis]|uniref:B-D-glucose-1-phosphatase n=1 Tax=Tritonibacter horizontis TaxID=1768241 RepID=A0A132BX95_9RHOB|nr:HAD family phosphatase [Tritonibacter horizontis]KUP93001.1 b-D-glucose-1-phosphatase [Tritonibacter horizontis]